MTIPEFKIAVQFLNDHVKPVKIKTEWHEMADLEIDLKKAYVWDMTDEKFLFVEHNVIDMIEEWTPHGVQVNAAISPHEKIDYVEDRFIELLICAGIMPRVVKTVMATVHRK